MYKCENCNSIKTEVKKKYEQNHECYYIIICHNCGHIERIHREYHIFKESRKYETL
jgi:RNase P subunit RPR2